MTEDAQVVQGVIWRANNRSGFAAGTAIARGFPLVAVSIRGLAFGEEDYDEDEETALFHRFVAELRAALRAGDFERVAAYLRELRLRVEP